MSQFMKLCELGLSGCRGTKCAVQWLRMHVYIALSRNSMCCVAAVSIIVAEVATTRLVGIPPSSSNRAA